MAKNTCKTPTRDPPKTYTKKEYINQYMFYINKLKIMSGLRPSVVPAEKEKDNGMEKK